jgi:hypothetical protein
LLTDYRKQPVFLVYSSCCVFMKMKVILNPHSRGTLKMKNDIYLKITVFIIELLKMEKQVVLLDLLQRAECAMQLHICSDAKWHVLKVKQDLEARRVIKVTRDLRDGSLQTIRLFHYREFEKFLHAQQ